jgi:hypothetical protein
MDNIQNCDNYIAIIVACPREMSITEIASCFICIQIEVYPAVYFQYILWLCVLE